MDAMGTRVAQLLRSAQAAFRHDDEEFDTPPRWLRSRVPSSLVLDAAIDDRLARSGDSRRMGGE